jgi:formylglycine-generating enzyme required for sulfatase activity
MKYLLWQVLAIHALVFNVAIASSSNQMQVVGNLFFDLTEVNIADFAAYVEATDTITSAEKNGGGFVYANGWERKPNWNWRTPFGSAADSRLPAVHITFDEAAAFCRWAGKRLPNDLEWESAAYTETRPNPPEPFVLGKTYAFPTGMEPTGANCLDDCGETTAIDFSAQLNRGVGPALVATSAAGVNGLYDMGANVWEWTDIDSDSSKGTRGGSWWYGKTQMSHEHKASKSKDMAAVYIGFRCVLDNKTVQ